MLMEQCGWYLNTNVFIKNSNYYSRLGSDTNNRVQAQRIERRKHVQLEKDNKRYQKDKRAVRKSPFNHNPVAAAGVGGRRQDDKCVWTYREISSGSQCADTCLMFRTTVQVQHATFCKKGNSNHQSDNDSAKREEMLGKDQSDQQEECRRSKPSNEGNKSPALTSADDITSEDKRLFLFPFWRNSEEYPVVWAEEVQRNVSMSSFTCALPENLTFNVKEASRSEVPTTALYYFLAQSAWRNHSTEEKISCTDHKDTCSA